MDDLQNVKEYKFPNKQGEGWNFVEDFMPLTRDDVEVIGRNYAVKDIYVGTARFEPTQGWQGMKWVYAWREKQDNSVMSTIREKYPPTLF